MDWMYAQRPVFSGQPLNYLPVNKLPSMPTERMGIQPMGLLEWLLWRSRGALRGANIPEWDLENQLRQLQQMQQTRGPLT